MAVMVSGCPRSRVRWPAAGVLSRLLAALAGLCWAAAAAAHEVQPAIADITLFPDRAEIVLRMNIEAPAAGLNLEGLFNTNDAENADEYDRLRALPPPGLETAFRRAWPGIRERITLEAGGTAVTPEIGSFRIPDVGNVELPRSSVVTLSAELPADASPVVFGWEGSLGPVVVRQMGAENGYTGFLTNGALSAPMPRDALAPGSPLGVFADYLRLGFETVVLRGPDHVLFVLGLFFLSLSARALLWQAGALVLGSAAALALGALGVVQVPGGIVAPLIAASLVYVGVENVLAKGMPPWRPAAVFGFGLVHGLGFAAVLQDLGAGSQPVAARLIGFGAGVELGLLAVLAGAFLAVGLWFGRKGWYRARVADPASVAIALAGGFWVVERTLL